MDDIKCGDRVLSVVGTGGLPRHGTVTAIIRGPILSPDPQFFVRFDGDEGHSGPCFFAQKVGR
jgi:hypothetical protein